MAKFDPKLINQIRLVADKYGIDHAGFLAVVEIESAGVPFEQDGRTPRLLFERHKFYEGLLKYAPGQLQRAISNGMAHKDWRRRTQYKDQGTSAERLALFARAKTYSEEAAYYACSWGLGQTMGFLAQEQGFSSPKAFIQNMIEGGVQAQIEAMAKELKNKNAIGPLNRKEWAVVARKYNGPGYKQNSYDLKMASARARWAPVVAATPLDNKVAAGAKAATHGGIIATTTTTVGAGLSSGWRWPLIASVIVAGVLAMLLAWWAMRGKKAEPVTITQFPVPNKVEDPLETRIDRAEDDVEAK